MPQDFDCPTGNCAEEEPDCHSVQVGDTIEAGSKLHRERNKCNRCPRTPPRPVHIEKRGFRGSVETVVSHWTDSEGNTWAADNPLTAWWYHGDPFLEANRDDNNKTFRVVSTVSGKGGWQCTYRGGVLDDQSELMGTYDYAPAGTSAHVSMDVTPHSDRNYTPNLTEQF